MAIAHDDIVSVAYEASLNPEKWKDVIGLTSERLAAKSSMMIRAGESFVAPLTHNLDPDIVDLYNDVFRDEDPWQQGLGGAFCGRIMTGQEIRPTQTFKNTEYFEALHRPADIWDCLGIHLHAEDGSLLGLVFHRGHTDDLFGSDDKRVLEEIAPHLKRAAHINALLLRSRLRGEWSAQAADCNPHALFIISRARKILYHNAAAERLLLEGGCLRVAAGLLAGAHPSGAGRFRDALDCVVQRGQAKQIVLTRDGEEARAVVLTPLPFDGAGTAWIPDVSSGLVLVTVCQPAEGALDPILLSELFGLTPAEGRLASLLCDGYGLQECATKLNIAYETGRKQVQSILAKTGTARQAAFVSLALRSLGCLGHHTLR